MAFPKGERAKGMKGIVHKLEFSLMYTINHLLHTHEGAPLKRNSCTGGRDVFIPPAGANRNE